MEYAHFDLSSKVNRKSSEVDGRERTDIGGLKSTKSVLLTA